MKKIFQLLLFILPFGLFAQENLITNKGKIVTSTTVGTNLLKLPNPSAITFPKINADNTVTARTPAQVLTDIGGQGALTLTTTGTSGASTLVGNTLNIPQYTGGGGVSDGDKGDVVVSGSGAVWEVESIAKGLKYNGIYVDGVGSGGEYVTYTVTNIENYSILKLYHEGSIKSLNAGSANQKIYLYNYNPVPLKIGGDGNILINGVTDNFLYIPTESGVELIYNGSSWRVMQSPITSERLTTVNIAVNTGTITINPFYSILNINATAASLTLDGISIATNGASSQDLYKTLVIKATTNAVILKHNVAGLKLPNNQDFVLGVNDKITLIRSGSTDWQVLNVSKSIDPWTYLKLTSNFTTSSATAVDITGLAFTPAANTAYEFEAILMLRTATTSVGPRPGLAWNTGNDDGTARIMTPSSATAFTTVLGNISAALLAAVGGLPVTTASFQAEIKGTFDTGASPTGTLKLQLASETGGTTVTAKAGSFLRYRAI